MSNIYESAAVVAEYLLFHYGKAEEVLPWKDGPRAALGFAARIVERFSCGEARRALDLGCAVGRSSFELSRTTGEVLGIDYSEALIAAARSMQEAGRVETSRLEEAHRSKPLVLEAAEEWHPERVRFEQGDAMNLREDLGAFDRVLAANLLCRLSDPQRLLDRLPSLVRSGGELILTTPCTWLEEFTPPENWPPGGTFPWLCSRLEADFELLEEHDEPFLIRETARKFQWTVALLTKWRRK